MYVTSGDRFYGEKWKEYPHIGHPLRVSPEAYEIARTASILTGIECLQKLTELFDLGKNYWQAWYGTWLPHAAWSGKINSDGFFFDEDDPAYRGGIRKLAVANTAFRAGDKMFIVRSVDGYSVPDSGLFGFGGGGQGGTAPGYIIIERISVDGAVDLVYV